MTGTRIRTVLVVDDDPIYRSIMESFLVGKGVTRILSAADGREGTELLSAHRGAIDLILCDLNMPDLDGIEFLERIRTDNSRTPLILITTALPAVVDAARSLATHYGLSLKKVLGKPVDFAALTQILADLP